MAAVIYTRDNIESWMAVGGFPNYEVSSFGRVRNARGHMLSPSLSGGYPHVVLSHEGKRSNLTVHRLVAMTFFPTSDLTLEVDHRDRNRMNNMVQNLRWVSHSSNVFNQSKRAGASSRFRGVCWYKPTSKWLVQITIDGKSKHIGYFDDELDAARAYNDALIRFDLDEAIPNDLPEPEVEVEAIPVLPALKPKLRRRHLVDVSEPDTESGPDVSDGMSVVSSISPASEPAPTLPAPSAPASSPDSDA
jgi:hypothetical protein